MKNRETILNLVRVAEQTVHELKLQIELAIERIELEESIVPIQLVPRELTDYDEVFEDEE